MGGGGGGPGQPRKHHDGREIHTVAPYDGGEHRGATDPRP